MNRRKSKILSIIFLICCYLSCAYSVFAAANSIVTSVLNSVEMGIVDISLKEYMLDEEGREVEWTDQQDMLPGAFISKIPRITNEAMECWIRAKVKIEFKAKTEISKALSMDEVRGISKAWVQVGDYFYYTKSLNTGESVDLFKEIEIPDEWENEYEESNIKITIQADAVQAQNFTPDFKSEIPWGGLTVQKCIHEGEYDINTFRVETQSTLSVQYEGEAKKLVAVPDDFFEGFGTLMPGDSEEGNAAIENKSEKRLYLFFKTENVEEATLLEKIGLKIENKIGDGETQLVYEGNLSSKELKEYQLLGTYEPGAIGSFHFTIQVPEELDNEYTLERRKVKWYFMAREEEETSTTATEQSTTAQSTTATEQSTTAATRTSQSTSGIVNSQESKTTARNWSSNASNQSAGGTAGNTSQNSYKNSGQSQNTSARTKTGDDTPLLFFIVCAILSMAGIIVTTKKIKS